jgi:polar amino acid transport system permease protein
MNLSSTAPSAANKYEIAHLELVPKRHIGRMVAAAVVLLLLVASFWYLIVVSVLSVGQFYIERYFGRGVKSIRSSV